MMDNPIMKLISLTERELNEIRLCMYYTERLKHGTAGHNRMVLIASLAHSLGFVLDADNMTLTVPGHVSVEPGGG